MMYVCDPCSCFLLLCILIVNIVAATKTQGAEGAEPLFGLGRRHAYIPPCVTRCVDSYGKKDHPDGQCSIHARNGGCDTSNKNHEAWRKRCPRMCEHKIWEGCESKCRRQ